MRGKNIVFKSGSYTLAEVASALNGQYPGEFDTFLVIQTWA